MKESAANQEKDPGGLIEQTIANGSLASDQAVARQQSSERIGASYMNAPPDEHIVPASVPLSEPTNRENRRSEIVSELPRLITRACDPEVAKVAGPSDSASNPVSLPEPSDLAATPAEPTLTSRVVAPKTLPSTMWTSSLTKSAQETGPKPILRHTTKHRTGVFRGHALRAEHKVIGLGEYGLEPSILDARQQELADGERSHHRSSESSFAPKDLRQPLCSVEQMEEEAREEATSNPWYLLWFGMLAALKVMGLYLITLETILACLLTAGFTCYWYFAYLGDPKWNGGGLDFILLAFTVTTPIATAIGMAFTRRERALIALGDFRSCSHHLFLSHCLWDWNDKGGRAGAAENGVDWVEHVDAVMAQLVAIGDELSRFLTLPTVSRSRHRMTARGRKEARLTVKAAYYLIDSIETQRITRLVMYSERLKKIGLPSGELSRLRQVERFISLAVEQLRLIKMYRTPQALRSFARVFTVLLPPFYAPTFAQVARDTGSLGMGICFGVIACLCLTSLFESLQVLEDPFTAFLALDGIDVREELEVLHFAQLLNTRQIAFPDAPPFPAGRRAALIATADTRALDRLHHWVGRPPVQTHHGAHKHAGNLVTFDELDVPKTVAEESDKDHEDMELGTPLLPDADEARFHRDPFFSDDDDDDDDNDDGLDDTPSQGWGGHFRASTSVRATVTRSHGSLSQRLARRAQQGQQ